MEPFGTGWSASDQRAGFACELRSGSAERAAHIGEADGKRKELETANSKSLEATEKNVLQLAESDSAERERNSAQDEIPVSGNQNTALQPMADQESNNPEVVGIAEPRDYSLTSREITIPPIPYAIIPASADVHGHLNDAVTSLRQALAAMRGVVPHMLLQGRAVGPVHGEVRTGVEVLDLPVHQQREVTRREHGKLDAGRAGIDNGQGLGHGRASG